MMQLSRIFSPTTDFEMPSLLASRTFLAGGTPSWTVIPFDGATGAGTLEIAAGITGDVAFTGLAAFVGCADDPAGLSFCPATSFFHFLTVSFAKSATFLSS
jgi:hypothetical protein